MRNFKLNHTQDHIRILLSYRGLAALVVCFGHIIYHVDDYFSNDFLLKAFRYAKKGVQVFFIISGIVIPLSMFKLEYSYGKFKRFLIKRLLRIEPPYLVTIIIAFPIFYIIYITSPGLYWNNVPSLQNIILHLGYLVPFVEGESWMVGAFWTLAIEFQYYLFLALLFPLIYWRGKLGMALFFLLFLTIPFLFPQPQFFPWWGAYFSLGIAFSFYLKGKINLKEYGIIMILAAIVILTKQGKVDLLIALLILGSAHILPNFKSTIGEFLGKISYSLYLTHFVGVLFIAYMSDYYNKGCAPYWVLLGAVGLSILFAYFFWKFIEKPSHKFSRSY